MTLLVTSILAENMSDLRTRAERAWRGGADAIEVRIDAFDGDPGELAAYLNLHRDRVWLVTCRSATEGGHFRGDTMQRVSLLIAAGRATNAYVDFEFADWRRSANIQQKVRLASAGVEGRGCPVQRRRLILSSHSVEGPPCDVNAVVQEISRVESIAAAKVAYRGRHIVDSFAALDLMHARGPEVIAIAMGEEGSWSRVLAKKLNAFATFASLSPESATAEGQITLRDLVHEYHWSDIDASTKVYGVIGDPVAHSLSPFLFNRWFAEAGVNAVYLRLRVGGEENGLHRFLDGCAARPWLDLRGFSVTVPHKETALSWTGAAGDSLTRAIGAVNTLAFDKGKVTVYNTDCYATISSLTDALGCSRSDLPGLTVDVLGAGGAARAVLAGLRDFGCRVTVYGRTAERTQRVADDCGFLAARWDDRVHRRGEVLIHCTPIGLWPEADASPMPAETLAGCRLVFDLIYRPLETKLLQDAAAHGCRTLNGLDMFVRQAATQFELWTGLSPNTRHAVSLLTDEITRTARAARARAEGGCIVLVGMRGSGKTIVGRELARLLGGAHIDTDEQVTLRTGGSIADLFAQDGEARFRRLEREAIADAVAASPAVISVGGGAILDEQNVQTLRAAATLVWLTAPVDVLWRRIRDDPSTAAGRPPLTGAGGREEVERLLAERSPLYDRAADFTVDASLGTPAEVAREIVQRARDATWKAT